jgi:hypothetical protein
MTDGVSHSSRLPERAGPEVQLTTYFWVRGAATFWDGMAFAGSPLRTRHGQPHLGIVRHLGRSGSLGFLSAVAS